MQPVIFVKSLSEVRTEQKAPGNIFITPNGDAFAWQANEDGTLHGIGGFFKSLGKALLPVAGQAASLIPGVGPALSATIGKLGQIGGSVLNATDGGGGGGGGASSKDAQAQQFIAPYLQAVQDNLQKLTAGQETPDQALQMDQQIYESFDPAKKAQKDPLPGKIYALEVQYLQPAFNQVKAAALRNAPITPTGSNSLSSAAGQNGAAPAGSVAGIELTTTNLAIGAAAIFGIFWLMRSK